MSAGDRQPQTLETAGRIRSDPRGLASAESVALAPSTLSGVADREAGTIVGAWAPTVLGFGCCGERRQTASTLDRSLGNPGVIERVETIVRGQ